ncbi:hypothetical protein K438DRAFT_1782818 [Mycena galopus ATCC 62051]|nr:hypothetical protein K438DRAFT_1782818 [Mycena galopus ATCC 62051]
MSILCVKGFPDNPEAKAQAKECLTEAKAWLVAEGDVLEPRSVQVMDKGSTYCEELKKFLQKKGATVKFMRQKYDKICQHILKNIRALLREPTAAHFYEKQLHDWAKPPEYVSRYFLSSGAHGFASAKSIGYIDRTFSWCTARIEMRKEAAGSRQRAVGTGLRSRARLVPVLGSAIKWGSVFLMKETGHDYDMNKPQDSDVPSGWKSESPTLPRKLTYWNNRNHRTQSVWNKNERDERMMTPRENQDQKEVVEGMRIVVVGSKNDETVCGSWKEDRALMVDGDDGATEEPHTERMGGVLELSWRESSQCREEKPSNLTDNKKLENKPDHCSHDTSTGVYVPKDAEGREDDRSKNACREFLKAVNPGRGQTVRIGIRPSKEEEGTVWELTDDMYLSAGAVEGT